MTGIKEIKMRNIEVVDIITQYLMIFGLLLGDIKKLFYRFILDRLSIRYLIQIILKASKDNSFCNLTNIVQFHSSASNFQLKTKLINIYFG